jgi:hypothetical protein
LVLKGEGFAHKTEANAVVLNILNKEQVIKEATHIESTSFLLEEMITDNIAELLVGVVRDPAHGFILSIAAGGTFTELIKDTTSLIIPIEKDEILKALEKLRIYSLINGYRGNSKANLDAIIDAIMSIQNFVIDNSKSIEEIEVNPLICGREKAIAADLLLRRS